MYEARIIGTGSYLPHDALTNEGLYPRISGFDGARSRESFAKRGEDVSALSDAQVFDKWVRQVCGIGERHIFGARDIAEFNKPDLYDPHRHAEIMGALAAERAIAMAGIDRAEIDTVIFSTVTSDTLIPNPAVIASLLLGLGDVATLTTNTACSGFLDALGDGWARIRSGLSECALIISSEQFSGRIKYDDVTTAILFGDGAGAVVLKKSAQPGVRSWWAGSRYSTNIAMNYNGPVVMGGGPLVQKYAVNAMQSASNKALEKAGVTLSDIHLVVPHQANVRILMELARKFGLPEEKVVMVIEKVANISTATIPVALDIYRRGLLPGRPYKPDSLLLGTSVGGGYAYTGSVFSL